MLCIFNHTEKTEQKAIAQLAESKETAGAFSPLLVYSYTFFFISNFQGMMEWNLVKIIKDLT